MVVDDTNHPQLDTSAWPWVVNHTYPQPSSSDCAAVPSEQVCSVSVYIVCVCVCLYTLSMNMLCSGQRMDCGFPGITNFDCINKVS